VGVNLAAHSRTLRTGRRSVGFQHYLLTTVTKERRRLFEDFWLGCTCARALTLPRLLRQSRLVAWVLMPDHAHLLVELAPDDSLPRLMRSLKSVSALEVGRICGRPGIWQDGYHDHALRSAEDIRAAARYLVANPVRAGLVRDVREYSFWDAVWVSGGGAALDP
jgi:REP element-mobilizing transposase RayT